MEEPETIKVFISYSQTNSNHQDWTIRLANRLRHDGVDVVLDKWDLKPGHDLHKFMESMVSDVAIKKVLIICDKTYVDKANDRRGGVGTETEIITPGIYKASDQEKFIPIVTEKDEDGTPILPVYLKTRLYFDLSDESSFENNYEELLRNLFNRPSISKPALGNPPKYLFQDAVNTFKTSFLVNRLDNQMERNPDRLNGLIQEFLDCVFEEMNQFEIVSSGSYRSDAGKALVNFSNQYTPIRNDFILFFQKLIRSQLNFDFDIIISFFEKMTTLLNSKGNGSHYAYQYEGFLLPIHEFFLYLVALGLKYRSYEFIENLFSALYFTRDRENYQNEGRDYTYFISRSIEDLTQYYVHIEQQRYTSPLGHLFTSRLMKEVSKQELVEADLLCHYIAVLKKKYWFPYLYIYFEQGNYREVGRIEILYRMISRKHLEKVKRVFGFETIESFKQRLIELKSNPDRNQQFGFSDRWDRILAIFQVIDPDKIGSQN
ncbi:SEFIR domain-containing protein [Algoriphagus aquaeductus]|uniref:SEFIR domain-containing protein n=1 Tax=Algoriphagus aquaeductus TaxID=475299 RepID=A0A326RJM3_9BACT|nr:toll/interleukin-1 receptor domain-containing protein [Algoriphagus aquaeductus]PZV75496.1 SEFIR domain-containing protein [Algoriphagus aquaeductus]